MKIAIVIGHHEKAKGALSKYFGMREFDFYKEVIKYIHYVGECFEVDFFEHDSNISGYTTRIKETANKLNKKEYKLVISLHFNSFFETNENGVETLYYYNSKVGKHYSILFNNFMYNKTGITNRGVKALRNKKDRGFAMCYYPKAPTILIEPFFGSNENDCKKIQSPQNLGNLLNEFIYQISS